ncbi:hypothetical protein Hanom_Chr00s130622g01815231 [Helianthus anomalus]
MVGSGFVFNRFLGNYVVRTTTGPSTPYPSGFVSCGWNVRGLTFNFKKVESEMPDLVEDDQKEVALINYRHNDGHEFKHVSEWEAIRIWF